jgi:hypothetical protein
LSAAAVAAAAAAAVELVQSLLMAVKHAQQMDAPVHSEASVPAFVVWTLRRF